MSTVFLIGNGFDLSCGMKTRYTDMYKDYCKIQENDTAIIKQFKQDISNNEYETWADFELGMAKYAKKFSTENDFLSCLWDFEQYLINYLQKEQNSFKNKVTSDIHLFAEIIEEMKKSTNDFYKGFSPNLNNVIEKIKDEKKHFICFNYTNIFELFAKNLDLSLFEYNYSQIHGTLENDAILGVDNQNQVETKFLKNDNFNRSFIKPIANEEFDYRRVFNAKEFINKSNLICTYGLSLGESDLTWRELILDRLQNEPTAHLFFYEYKLSIKKDLLQNQQRFFEEQEKKELAHKWQLKDDSEILNRIHIPCGKQIFKIKEVIENHKSENSSVD